VGGYFSSILEQVRHTYRVFQNLEYLANGNRTLYINISQGIYLGTMGSAKVLEKFGLSGCGDMWDV
jgi:hypothetical protein